MMRSAISVGKIVNDVEGVIHNKPLDGVAKVSFEHGLARGDLLGLSIIVVLNFELAHIELRDRGFTVV